MNYGEKVTLVRPALPAREMALAEAVEVIMHLPDIRDRLSAGIARDGDPPLLRYEDIAAIYSDPDFPRSEPFPAP